MEEQNGFLLNLRIGYVKIANGSILSLDKNSNKKRSSFLWNLRLLIIGNIGYAISL